MTAVTSIDNSVALLNKFNTTVENNISVHNEYTKKIRESFKVIDKTKNIDRSKNINRSKNIDKTKNIDRSKRVMNNSNNVIINVMNTMAQNQQVQKDTEIKEETQKKEKKKMTLIPNIPMKLMTGTINRFKNIWNGSIGKGLKLGITQDKATNKVIKDISKKWTTAWAKMGKKLAPVLRTVLSKIAKLMDSPAFTNMMKFIYVFIGALINGVSILLDYLSPVLDVVSGIFSFMFDNAEYILTILIAIASAIAAISIVLGIYNLVTKAYNMITTISSKVTDALGDSQKKLPIVFIISLIITLITIFITLIATMEPVRTAVVNLTRCFFDFIEWGINNLIEGLASAVEGIIRFAGDGINAFLNIFVNPFIAGINLIIGAMNLLGANIDKLDYMKVDFSGAAEATGDFIRKGKVDLSGAKEAVAGAIENFSAESLKEKLGIGKLQEDADKDVGVQINKINDDVNIADEDVKLMRDVAEREMIQNFVTLTPTVSMGDMTVNENADADQLLGKITEVLVTEVTNSAQGVYA